MGLLSAFRDSPEASFTDFCFHLFGYPCLQRFGRGIENRDKGNEGEEGRKWKGSKQSPLVLSALEGANFSGTGMGCKEGRRHGVGKRS